MNQFKDINDHWEEEKRLSRENAKKILDTLELPDDHTYIWVLKVAQYDHNTLTSKYGATKSGLRSALNSMHREFKHTIRIAKMDDFEMIYDDRETE